jgi:putative transposase
VLVAKGLSTNRACWLLGLNRATYSYQPRPKRTSELAKRIGELAQKHPRYGYRRIHALLRREGRIVNRKQVQRLWQQARLQVRKQPRKRGGHRAKATPVQADYPCHVWSYDFVKDQTQHGTPLRILTVMDEFTREGLAIAVGSSMLAERVIEVLKRLVEEHGAPAYIRSDNGPEFIALALRLWLAGQEVQTLYIDPGSPWQNGREERFNGSVRDECLNMELFASVSEARLKLEEYRRQYNHERPHSSRGYLTPLEFKQAWFEEQAKRPETNVST